MKLIGLAGFKQAGKSSTASFLKAKGFVEMAFADPVRQLAEAIDPVVSYVNKVVPSADNGLQEGAVDYVVEALHYNDLLKRVGYEKAKQNPEVRRVLQRIGTEAGRCVLGQDIWVRILATKVAEHQQAFPGDSRIVVSDCRFPNEVETIHALGGVVWRITRKGQEQTDLHESEQHIPHLDVDHDLKASNLTELSALVDAAFDELVIRGL
jgi:rhodanese-related sulfurtransferase